MGIASDITSRHILERTPLSFGLYSFRPLVNVPLVLGAGVISHRIHWDRAS